MEQQEILVPAEGKNERLDKFLTGKLGNLTRSQVKKLILQQRILVNEEKPSVHQFLKEGDRITMTAAPTADERPLPEIRIIEKGDGFVVIDKPAGVLVHPAKVESNEPTLVDWIKKTFPEAASVGYVERPGIVHRLDRDTSGAMVIATTQAMYDHLKQQFLDRKVKKQYLALVHDHVRDDEGEIRFAIGRSRNKARMAARAQDVYDTDREAVTRYKVLTRFNKPFTLVQAEPLTGRTHQIRVHFQSLGFPVVGDQVYTITKQRSKIDLGRHFLHAQQLSFTDVAGNEHTVQSALPPDLQQYLDKLT